MRLILFQAVVLAFASCAAAQRPKNIQVPPHAGINQFPAGPIVPNFPYAVPFYQAPPVPANSYRGTYEHVTCSADVLIAPESTAELSAAIKDVRRRAEAEGRPLRMRPARNGFATMSSFACTNQPTLATPFKVQGKDPLRVGLMLEKMNKVLSVDKEAKQIKVQAQMTLKGFYDTADAAHLSIPVEALPWWQGLTLGGVFATSSHGTGNNATHMICDWFVDVTWVDARGDIHVSKKGSEEAVALCGGLGLMGTITEITLQMNEWTNSRFFTWYLKDDTNLAEDVEKMLKITPHLVVMWRPDIGKYTGHLQELNTDPNAHVIKDASCNVIPQVPDALAGMGGPLLRAWQSDPWNRNSMYYQMGFDSQICNLAMTNAVGAAWMTKPGPLGRAGYTAIPLFEGVAPTNHAASTECGQDCAFVSKKLMATALDVMFAFERNKLKDWVADIKELIQKDLRGRPGWGAHTRCILPGYYVMRFGRTPESLIGYGSGLKQPVYVQQQMLATKGGATPGVPSRYEWVQEVYEQLTLCKYNGQPHTGKNWDRTFTNPRCPLAPKYGDRFQKMLDMTAKYDPEAVYEPELWTRVKSGTGYALKPKCILDRSCYCETDEHCSDNFMCVPSMAFPEYKNCIPKVMN